MKFTSRFDRSRQATIFTFPCGAELAFRLNSASLEIPPRDGVGSVGCIVRHPGDVLHALMTSDAPRVSLDLVPASCRTW